MAQVMDHCRPLLSDHDRHSSDIVSCGRIPNGTHNNGKVEVVLDVASEDSEETALYSDDISEDVYEEEIEEIVIGKQNGLEQVNDEYHGLYSFLGDRPTLGPMLTIDPFRNHTESIGNLYEWIKTVLCLPLAIIRFLLVILITVIGILFAKVILFGWRNQQAPIPKWRRRILYITRLLGRIVLFLFGYHWIRRHGKLTKREIAPIIISNHVSFIDPIFFFYELLPSFVSSASHSDLPGIGMIIRPMQVINVDRSSSESKKQALKEIKSRAMNNNYPHVMLFPEGTTTNGRSLIFFQHGAFIPGLPVQPVILRYPYVHFDNSWGRISILKLLFRMLTQLHNFMEVEYLPVVYPSSYEKDHPFFFAKKVKSIMAKALNVAETDCSYGDLILSTKATVQNPMLAAGYVVEMAKFEKIFHISTKEAIVFLEKFQSMDSENRGYVSKEQYIEALGLPTVTISCEIFGFFDREGQGWISFREFLSGSAFILKHHSFESICVTAFNSCDLQNQGYLSILEVEEKLRSVFPDFSHLQVQEMYSKLDRDGDGTINWNDFKSFLGGNPELLPIFLPQNTSSGYGGMI